MAVQYNSGVRARIQTKIYRLFGEAFIDLDNDYILGEDSKQVFDNELLDTYNSLVSAISPYWAKAQVNLDNYKYTPTDSDTDDFAGYSVYNKPDDFGTLQRCYYGNYTLNRGYERNREIYFEIIGDKICIPDEVILYGTNRKKIFAYFKKLTRVEDIQNSFIDEGFIDLLAAELALKFAGMIDETAIPRITMARDKFFDAANRQNRDKKNIRRRKESLFSTQGNYPIRPRNAFYGD